MRRAAALLLLVALPGCGGDDADTPASEARQLDEAAAATDINVALTDNGAAEESGR